MREDLAMKAVMAMADYRRLKAEGVLGIDPREKVVQIDGRKFRLEFLPGEITETYNSGSLVPWRYTKQFMGIEFVDLEIHRRPDFIGRPHFTKTA